MAALWLLLLLMAGLRPLAVPDEGRYGEVGRWMLQSGDWLTPRLNGLPFFHKPPLLYWLEAAALALFGISELALRLVPALHAGLMLVALYLAAQRVGGEAIARRAIVMLGTSLSFLVGGQYINHDMLVASWIGVAIWCFAFAFLAGDKPDATLARLGAVACALGMLSKGLIGLALPGLVLLVWLILTRQLAKLRHFPWFSALALWAAVALPWFIVAQKKYPALFDYMFIGQQFRRYTAATYNNPQAWWFYLPVLALLLFPWVIFALLQARPQAGHAQHGATGVASSCWQLCWVWIAVIVVFFSIPHSKLVGYVLPVMPPLALLAALGWQRTLAARAYAGKLFAGLCAVNLALALTLMLLVGQVTRSSRAQDVAQVLACAAAPGDTIHVTDAYPYDLPFYAQTGSALVVLQDWAQLRQHAGDGWQRELFEGADFDARAAQVLQPQDRLHQAKGGDWLVLRNGSQSLSGVTGWRLFYQGAGWTLYRAAASTPEGPPAAQAVGLPGCQRQRQK